MTCPQRCFITPPDPEVSNLVFSFNHQTLSRTLFTACSTTPTLLPQIPSPFSSAFQTKQTSERRNAMPTNLMIE
jgi:hypothetical protein